MLIHNIESTVWVRHNDDFVDQKDSSIIALLRCVLDDGSLNNDYTMGAQICGSESGYAR
jgi:hypothetical protein